MLNIYKRFWQVNWAEQWQYRANLMMYLAYGLVSPITYLAVWSAIADAQGNVNGLTSANFAAYYLTLLPVDILTTCITIYYLAYKIQDGTLSNELLQPVHPILTNTLVNNLAFKILQTMIFVPIWIALVLLFRPTFTYTWQSLLLSAPAIGMGFFIRFLLESTLTLIAFWTTRVWAIYHFDTAVSMLLNGAFVPLVLLPAWAQTMAHLLPYQLTLSFPILLLLNQLPLEQILLNYGLQVFWLIVLYGLFNFVWRQAIKQFSAVGA